MAKKKRDRALEVRVRIRVTQDDTGGEIGVVSPPDGPAATSVGSSPPPPVAAEPQASHSPDFASVNWYGTVYTFSPQQRLAVAALWHAREQGYLWLSTETILEAAESASTRVSEIFKKHPAWGVMIVPALAESGKPGTYRLGNGSTSECTARPAAE